MKGVVFTEFMDMVDSAFSPEVTEQIIEAADLPSGGSYTSVGTYHHGELVQLVGHLSEQTRMPVPELLEAYGRYLFTRFVKAYPHLFVGATSVLDFLPRVHGYIHVEVRKLYPDAELPRLACQRLPDGRLEVIYRSERAFADFARGLILGCAEHFGERISIEQTNLDAETGTAVRFIVSVDDPV